MCIDALGALGAFDDVFGVQEAAMRAGLPPPAVGRIEEIDELRRQGEVTEEQLLERMSYLWPRGFADPANAAPNPIVHIGPECSIEVNASLRMHYAERLLERKLPELRMPTLFVHGELDPLPLRSTTATAGLVPGSLVETFADCGHFPWLEQPAAFRAAVEALLERAGVGLASLECR